MGRRGLVAVAALVAACAACAALLDRLTEVPCNRVVGAVAVCTRAGVCQDGGCHPGPVDPLLAAAVALVIGVVTTLAVLTSARFGRRGPRTTAERG